MPTIADYMEHWPRWTRASINTHFKDELPGLEVDLVFEPQLKQVDQECCIVRVDGPHITKLSNIYYRLDIVINILSQIIIKQDDLYRLSIVNGLIAKAFTTNIPAFKYGNTPLVDDSSLWGCYVQQTEGGSEALVLTAFGKVAPDVNIEQVSAEAHYRMSLSLR